MAGKSGDYEGPKMADWFDPKMPIEKLLTRNAFLKLSPRGKGLTGVQVARLSYWGRVGMGDPSPNEDPVLKDWQLDDYHKLHDALATHIKELTGQDWQYLGVVAGGGMCFPCCAVVALPDVDD